MKARLNTTTARSFSLVFALLLLMAAWGFSISAAQQQDEKNTEQTAANPASASSPGEEQQVQSAPQSPDQTVGTQPLGEAAPQPEGAAWSCPPEYIPLIQKTTASLMAGNFTFIPVKALDPFVPFVSLAPGSQSRTPEEEEEPQSGAPLTPLQKMTLSEIERGLKAITWGELGTRAVIEDSTGRGYIVAVGTPAGEHGGVIKQILNDRLVIQQEIWDRKAKKRFPQDFTIKLVKKTDQKS
jgi:Tfp pilus assembly protein PilP